MGDKPDINVVLNFKGSTRNWFPTYKREDTFAEKVLKFFSMGRWRTPGRLELCWAGVESRFTNHLNKQHFLLHITNTYDGRSSTRKVRLKRLEGDPSGQPYFQMYGEPNENAISSWGTVELYLRTILNLHRYLVSRGYTTGDTLFIRVTYY